MLLRVLALAAPLTLLTACTSTVQRSPSAGDISASAWTVYRSTSPSPALAASFPPAAAAEGTFLPYRPGATAITYDPAVVPAGATARLTITNQPYAVEVRLTVSGLVPRRAYGAHLHTQPCTGLPDGAGPHYQHRHDPAAASSAPSVNPSYANAANEVWLDFTADPTGRAAAVSRHNWDFDAAAPPRSLIIHTEQTHTGMGQAGKAGARAACLTLPAG